MNEKIQGEKIEQYRIILVGSKIINTVNSLKNSIPLLKTNNMIAELLAFLLTEEGKNFSDEEKLKNIHAALLKCLRKIKENSESQKIELIGAENWGLLTRIEDYNKLKESIKLREEDFDRMVQAAAEVILRGDIEIERIILAFREQVEADVLKEIRAQENDTATVKLPNDQIFELLKCTDADMTEMEQQAQSDNVKEAAKVILEIRRAIKETSRMSEKKEERLAEISMILNQDEDTGTGAEQESPEATQVMQEILKAAGKIKWTPERLKEIREFFREAKLTPLEEKVIRMRLMIPVDREAELEDKTTNTGNGQCCLRVENLPINNTNTDSAVDNIIQLRPNEED